MHSSRMRTAPLLPVSPSMHCSRGGVPGLGGCTWSRGYLVWGVHGPRGVYLVLGVPGPGGCTWSQGDVPGPQWGVPGPRGVPAQVLPPP